MSEKIKEAFLKVKTDISKIEKKLNENPAEKLSREIAGIKAEMAMMKKDIASLKETMEKFEREVEEGLLSLAEPFRKMKK